MGVEDERLIQNAHPEYQQPYHQQQQQAIPQGYMPAAAVAGPAMGYPYQQQQQQYVQMPPPGTAYYQPQYAVPTVMMVNQPMYQRDDTCPAITIFILGWIFPPIWYGGFCFIRSRTPLAKLLGILSAVAAVVATSALIIVCALAAAHGPGFRTQVPRTQDNWTEYGVCPVCTGGSGLCGQGISSTPFVNANATCCPFYMGTCCNTALCNARYNFLQNARNSLSSIPIGCQDTFGLLNCAVCSPYAGNFFTQVSPSSPGTAPTICSGFCQRLYNSCVNATIATGPNAGMKVGDWYGSDYSSFCSSLPGNVQVSNDGAENVDCFNAAGSLKSNLWAILGMLFVAGIALVY